jgi:hypothetical protein
MNVYYAGDPIQVHVELLKEGQPFVPDTGWTAKVALLNKDYTVAIADRTADIDQPDDSNITAVFTAAETAPLAKGIYYVRSRLEHTTEGPITFRPEAIEIQVVA